MSRPTPATHRIHTGPDGRPRLVKRATEAPARARLAAEAGVLRALAHPSLVAVADLVEADDATELHLAWVGPHSLATITGVAPAAAARLVADLAATVADVHRAGLVHGRITADHVLVGADGRPVLTGLADAAAVGPGDPAGDVAALGALLTELVRPHAEAPAVPESRRHRHGDDGLRGALLTLADRAQADDPALRPTAAELAEDLRATAGPPPRRSRRSRPPIPPARPPTLRRHRTGPVTSPPPPPAEPARDPAAAGIPTGSGRRRLAAAGLVLCMGATAVAAAVLADDEPLPSAAPPPTRAHRPAPATTATTATSAPAVLPVPAPTTTTAPPDCAPAGPAAVDTDGDGCPDPVRVEGPRVSVGPTTWVVGREGDRAAVGDWDCDGTATAAVLRPSTGEVFLYDRWVAPGDELTVGPAAHVDGAVDLRADDADGDGCPTLVATRPDAGPVPVTPEGAR